MKIGGHAPGGAQKRKGEKKNIAGSNMANENHIQWFRRGGAKWTF